MPIFELEQPYNLSGMVDSTAGRDREKNLLKPGSPLVFPQPADPDLARDDPEDRAGHEMQRVAKLEKTGGLAVILAAEFRKDMEMELKVYKAVERVFAERAERPKRSHVLALV